MKTAVAICGSEASVRVGVDRWRGKGVERLCVALASPQDTFLAWAEAEGIPVLVGATEAHVRAMLGRFLDCDTFYIDQDGERRQLASSECVGPNPMKYLAQPPAPSLVTDLQRVRSRVHDVRTSAYGRLMEYPVADLHRVWEETRRTKHPEGWHVDVTCRAMVKYDYTDYTYLDRSIVTVCTPGYEGYLETMLRSLRRNGQTPESTVVVFAVDGAQVDPAWWSPMIVLPARSLEVITTNIKGLVYSLPRFIETGSTLAIETDVLILDSIQPLWEAIESGSPLDFYGVHPIYPAGPLTLRQAHRDLGGHPDAPGRLGIDLDQPFWFNGGVLGAQGPAWSALLERLEGLGPELPLWLEGGARLNYSEEWVANALMGQVGNPQQVSPRWNTQLYDADWQRWVDYREGQFWTGPEPVCILHCIGKAKQVMRDLEARVSAK